MEREYVATKSAWCVFSIWYILFCWLVIPLVIWIAKIVIIKNEKIYIKGRKVTERSGVLSKKETNKVLTNVLGVSVNQSFVGRIFHYGTVQVDVIGGKNLDFSMEGVKDPYELKEFLDQYVVDVAGQNQMIVDA